MTPSRKTIDFNCALALAKRVNGLPSDTLSDAALISRLADSARLLFEENPDELMEDALIDTLSLIASAVGRRMGVWCAVLDEDPQLSGPIREVRLLADDLLDPTDPDAPVHSVTRFDTLRQWATATAESECPKPEMQAALRWMLIARFRTRSEHPPHIHFPPDFYRSLSELDRDRCLLYTPTTQQLAAAVLLLDGAIVEMDAGEGKTLASAIAALVYAAAGRSVHILTANDYLAERDCDNLSLTMESLGITPGLVTANMDSEERRLQYHRPIVFATAREVGFDFLRDNIARRHDIRVSPTFDVAIVDEADHLLIDQARTPLIISGEPLTEYDEDEAPEEVAISMIEEQSVHVDALFDDLHPNGPADRTLATILLAEGLTPRLVSTLEHLGKSSRELQRDLLIMNDDDDDNPLETDLLFTIDAVNSALRITPRGWDYIADRLESPASAFEVVQILSARVVHESDEDYVIGSDGITLVDRLDGRPMHSHRYFNGLHEALESKEGIEGKARANPSARTTIHALMSNYATIAGLTGTATEAADIFSRDYAVSTVRVPPTFPPRRVDLDTRVFFDRSGHARALSEEVAYWHRIGRPVLIAFGSVRESSEFSDTIERQGIPHRLLNASNPAQESDIVERAGEFGAVTISTGMAGRGADIIVADDVDIRMAERLGQSGSANCTNVPCEAHTPSPLMGEGRGEDSPSPPSKLIQHPTDRTQGALGLLVIIASLPASRRVERQLRGRAGRQGSPGASVMMIHINDPILAFTRQQTSLYRIRNHGEKYVQGPDVEDLLRQAQSESDSRNRSIVEATAEFAAIIESESRAHYSHREALKEPRACRQLLSQSISDWIDRTVAPLTDIRADYLTTFDSVAESLWREHRIDLGPARLTSPAEATDALAGHVEVRVFIHRTRLGDRRFYITVSDMYLEALDAMWPDHLASIQDIALSIAMTAESHAAALTQFSGQALAARSNLRNSAADTTINSLLNSEYIEPPEDSDEIQIERLPSELSDLIT